MRRIYLEQWAKAGAAVLLLGAALVTGCEEVEDSESVFEEAEPQDQDQDQDEPSKRVQPGPEVIPGEYIVVVQDGASPRAVAAAVNATPRRVFTTVLNGFAAPLDEDQLQALEQDPEVEIIEFDQVMSAAQVCPDAVAQACGDYHVQLKSEMLYWGVDRIDQTEVPFSNDYTYSCTGLGVPVYVFDTGVEYTHSQFGGRAHFGYDAFGGDGEDCHGHGTHVAGLIAGKNYGVAKQSDVYSVRVLACNGKGSFSNLIDAMEWLGQRQDANNNKLVVANMSLAGFISWSVNIAVNNLVAKGVVVVAAAGNESANACWYSPGGASRPMTVAACNTTNERASFSNYGSCVDIYAPGTNLKSAWLNDGSRFASGTSMAAPHVAGIAAMYVETLAPQSISADRVMTDIEGWANVGVIVNNPNGTPNIQAHWPCGEGNGTPATTPAPHQ